MEASAVPRVAPTGVTGVASPQLLRLASDARLVALVRQGWPAAFEAVYNRHHRGILSFCRHVLSDADEAEDAVQHTFLAAYNDLIGSDKPIHLRAWLFTIARNRCYSILRARREQPAADLDEPVTEGLATQVQRRQDLRDLVLDLRSLPEEQRAALVLAEIDALSHEEIGEALGVPREKVKALVFQARESLVASRTARETACADIREQLTIGRGGALRRANLRRHLRDCAGCRDFRQQVERQRRQAAALLPLVPTLALKETVLSGSGSAGAGFGGGGAGFSGGGLVASSALKSGVIKGFATLMLATAGTAGTYAATHALSGSASHRAVSRPRLQAPPARVSPVGLAPSGRRPVIAAPTTHHAKAAVGARPLTHGALRPTQPTQFARPGHTVPQPFGPLAHNRANFPRKGGSRAATIAPPASAGKAPTLIAVVISSAPTATISSTSIPGSASPGVDRGLPESDRPASEGDINDAGSTGSQGVGGTVGVPGPRSGSGRPPRRFGDGARDQRSSGRSSGQPSRRDPAPLAAGAVSTRSGSSGVRPAPAGVIRVPGGDSHKAVSVDPGKTAVPTRAAAGRFPAATVTPVISATSPIAPKTVGVVGHSAGGALGIGALTTGGGAR